MTIGRKSWFIRSGRSFQGPISSAELQQMARAGVLKPDAEIGQSEDGPWRPARQLKGLVFPEPELPPLPKQSPFETFADSRTRPPAADAGILLESEAPPAKEELEPPLAFETAPALPAPAGVPDEAIPSFASSVTDFLSRQASGARQYPEYSALKAYGWLFRVGGIVLFGLGLLAFVGSLISLFWVEEGFRAETVVAGAAALIACFLLGFLLLISGDAILAFVDLVQDARRQRIAAERTFILLEEAFVRRTEVPPEKE